MAQIPHADPGLICPLHHKPMEEVCHTCPWWVEMRGKHPQTGAEMYDWKCAVPALLIATLENARQTFQAGAAVETMRNEIVRRMDYPTPPMPKSLSHIP